MTQMYKVFINNKCIFLLQNRDILNGREGKTHQYYSESALFDTIDDFEKDKLSENLFIIGNPDELLFKFPIIEAAGGLVKKTDNQLLFIYRYGKWDLPKGKMEPGEKSPETAIREVMEETGISGLEIIKELTPTFHTYRLEGKRVIKKTSWYEMSFKDDSQILPQKIEDITVVKWLNLKDIPWAMRNSYSSIIELLTSSGYL